MGGFPPLMFLEDVEFGLKLSELGPAGCLGSGVVASARAWRAQGFGYRFGRCAWLLRYLVESRLGCADPTGRRPYEAYYRAS